MIGHSNDVQKNHADEIRKAHIFVEGRVQGVGFRYFTVETANRFGIFGWVRNTHNHEVEIIAEGPKDKLDQFISIIRQGPNSGYVKSLRIDWLIATGEYNRFSIASSF